MSAITRKLLTALLMALFVEFMFFITILGGYRPIALPLLAGVFFLGALFINAAWLSVEIGRDFSYINDR